MKENNSNKVSGRRTGLGQGKKCRKQQRQCKRQRQCNNSGGRK